VNNNTLFINLRENYYKNMGVCHSKNEKIFTEENEEFLDTYSKHMILKTPSIFLIKR